MAQIKTDYTYTLGSGYSLVSWGSVNIVSYGKLISIRAGGLRCSRAPGSSSDLAITIDNIETLNHAQFSSTGTIAGTTSGTLNPVTVTLTDGELKLTGLNNADKNIAFGLIAILA